MRGWVRERGGVSSSVMGFQVCTHAYALVRSGTSLARHFHSTVCQGTSANHWCLSAFMGQSGRALPPWV